MVRLENGRSRDEIADHLMEEAARDPRFVVGLDFAFSFPAGFLRKRAHRRVGTVWDEVEALGEEWLAHCPSPPFWGKPGKKKPALGDALFRATDLAAAEKTGRRPLSVFQIGGVGTVGVGSIRGMPVLKRLRKNGFSVWPFDAPGSPLVVEIWPRVFMGEVRKSDLAARRRYLEADHSDMLDSARADAVGSDDAFDSLVSALAMYRHRGEFRRLSRAEDRVTRLEGAIWRPGVVQQ